MGKEPKSDNQQEDEGSIKPVPKRGAIPTPKSEIEKAKKYLPESNPAAGESESESVLPPDKGSKDDDQGHPQ